MSFFVTTGTHHQQPPPTAAPPFVPIAKLLCSTAAIPTIVCVSNSILWPCPVRSNHFTLKPRALNPNLKLDKTQDKFSIYLPPLPVGQKKRVLEVTKSLWRELILLKESMNG